MATILNCRECKLCNRKGLPSVSKGSAYCDMMRGTMHETRASIWSNINRVRDMFFTRGTR